MESLADLNWLMLAHSEVTSIQSKTQMVVSDRRFFKRQAGGGWTPPVLRCSPFLGVRFSVHVLVTFLLGQPLLLLLFFFIFFLQGQQAS